MGVALSASLDQTARLWAVPGELICTIALEAGCRALREVLSGASVRGGAAMTEARVLAAVGGSIVELAVRVGTAGSRAPELSALRLVPVTPETISSISCWISPLVWARLPQ